MDLLELLIQTQDHTSLCRAQGKIVWLLDNAPFKVVEIPFYRGRQRGREFGALAQVIGRTTIPFLRKDIVPAKRLGADLFEFAAPEVAEVVSGRKNFRTAADSVGRQALRKQLGSAFRKKTATRVIPTECAKQFSRS